MPLDLIDHIAINISDLEKAIKWYTTSFHSRIVYQDKRLAILEFANVRLHLVLPSEQPAHLAFVRDDAETLGELCEQKGGGRSTYVSDPLGNPVEIVAKDD